VLDAAAALASPRLVRRAARVGLLAYVTALAAATLEAARRRPGADYTLVPVVLATMHLAHGIGFLEGSRRWGVPWRALWRVAGGGGDLRPYRGPIDAPSLHDESARQER
jgi:hypothetical protein